MRQERSSMDDFEKVLVFVLFALLSTWLGAA